jgi:hypothetical protein
MQPVSISRSVEAAWARCSMQIAEAGWALSVCESCVSVQQFLVSYLGASDPLGPSCQHCRLRHNAQLFAQTATKDANVLGNTSRYRNDIQQLRVRGTGRAVSMLRRRRSQRIQASLHIITGRARTSWRRTPDWRIPRPRSLPDSAFLPPLPSFILGSL